MSWYLRRMLQANPPHSAAVLSVAYDAYGSALERQGRSDDALRAFDEAMKRDPTNGVSVVNTARARSVRRDYAGAAPLYLRAQSLQLPDAMKIAALRSRVFGATNTGDCDAAARAFADAKRSRLEWRTPSSTDTSGAVSYTHLDVYKRQPAPRPMICNPASTSIAPTMLNDRM